MPGCFPLGVATLWLWYLLDHVDGQLARLHNTQSVTGIYFDFMMHHLVHPAVAFAIGYGIASQTQYLPWTLGGAAFAFGLSTLSISNDCRYKAYFSNASRGLAMPLVAAQARGASRSPAATGGPSNETRSKRGRLSAGLKVLHATMLRLCEIPNIIVSLSILGTVAVWNPGLGNAVIQGYVLGMAVVAPTLGLMRLGKQVWYRLPDHEYISELYSFKRE
jgi:phosphatidylglycerophosphate synthase